MNKNGDFKFKNHFSLRDMVDDPLEEFFFLNEESDEEPKEIKHSFHDADRAIEGCRKAMIWDLSVHTVPH